MVRQTVGVLPTSVSNVRRKPAIARPHRRVLGSDLIVAAGNQCWQSKHQIELWRNQLLYQPPYTIRSENVATRSDSHLGIGLVSHTVSAAPVLYLAI